MKNNSLYVIIGISSYLGSELAKQLLTLNKNVVGTYHNDTLGLLQPIHSKYPKLKLYPLDVRVDTEINSFYIWLKKMSEAVTSLNLVYCCGRWHQGLTETLSSADIDNTIGINLRAPVLFATFLLKSDIKPFSFVFVTGLANSGGINGGGLYNICTNGIYTFIKTFALELATRPNCYCMGLALGLYNKGQPYFSALAQDLKLSGTGKLSDVAEWIIRLFQNEFPLINGAIIELSNCVQSYGQVINWLATH